MHTNFLQINKIYNTTLHYICTHCILYHSTIFKTINDDLGITKLSVNNGLKNVFNREFFKKQSVLSDSDIKSLQSYNAELERVIGYEVTNGNIIPVTTSAQTAFNRTMQDASVEAQNMAISANGLAVNLNEIPKVSKAGQVALSALATAGNMLLVWGVTKAIELAAKAINNYIHRVELAQEALKESSNAYETATSELQNLQTELQNTADRMAELETDGIELIEKDEYDRLVAANEELERSIALKKIEQQANAREAASNAVDLYNKMTSGTNAPSQENVISFADSTDFGRRFIDATDSKNDTNELLSAYVSLQEIIEDTKAEMNTLVDNDDEESQKRLTELQADLDSYELGLTGTMSLISENAQNYQNIYDGINSKKEAGLELTEAEIAAYNNADTALNLISNTLLSTEERLDKFISKNGLEEPLTKLFNSHKSLSETTETLSAQYPKLMSFLDETGMSVDDLTKKFGDLAESQQASNDTLPLSTTETIDQLNTQIKPTFDSLQSAYQDIFTDDGFELNSINIISTCDSIKSKLDDMAELGLNVDYSAYKDFVKILSDSESTEESVKQAFNSLAESITRAGLSGTENFKTLKAALEDLGVVNSGIIAFKALAENIDALKSAGLDLSNATYEQISVFASEYVSAENLAQAINMLTQQKMLNALEELNTSTEVSNMLLLAKQAGMTSNVIANLTELERIYQEVASGTLSEHMLSQKLSRAAELKDLIDADITKVDYSPQVDFNPIEKSVYSAAKSAAESFTDLLDKELNVLDKKMEAGYIDFKDYIASRLGLIEDYYRQGKLSADEYYSYLEKHYEKELSYMDKAVNAVTRRIDKEIDALEKQKNKIESSYQAQIDSLEEQKTLLQEVNKERERQINLQRALYELERAQNQRTVLMYSADKGMHYVADSDAVKDARQEAENAELEIKIAEIEKAISKLEEARDKELEAIDEMISKLQEYRDWWQDITSAYEEEQENLIAAQILGQDWEQQILEGRLDTLNKFKDDYIAIQQAMVDAAYQAAQAMANAQNVKIKDTSKGKTSLIDDSPAHGWEVIDESIADRAKGSKGFTSKAEAEAYCNSLNAQKAASLGMSIQEFNNSNLPGYYVKKYHTGLHQGIVKRNSFDEDFKLVQKIGLGKEDVPAILKRGEAVATPEQISNLADGLRDKGLGLPSYLSPLPNEHPMMQMSKKFETLMYGDSLPPFDNTALKKMSDELAKAVNTVNNISNSNNRMHQTVTQNISLNCPNVTNHSGIEYIQKELGHLSQMAMQEAMKY